MKYPFPERLSEIGVEFLTWALQSRGFLASNTRIVAYKFRVLDGGVHFEVGQFTLEYQQLDRKYTPKHSPPPPPTIVVKMINGNVSSLLQLLLLVHAYSPRLASLVFPQSWQQTVLRIKSYKIGIFFLLSSLTKTKKQVGDESFASIASFIFSFCAESRLYSKFTSILSIPTPKLYFCHGDEFTIQFLMILEDLCALDRGEPNGLFLSFFKFFFKFFVLTESQRFQI